MTPREHYEAADRLMDQFDETSRPHLLALAALHTAVAELHLSTCPNAAVEVTDASRA